MTESRVGKSIVTFEPIGKKIKTTAKTTILKLAKKAGVDIRSECGGKGICGKCRVIIKDSSALSVLTSAEAEQLSQSEINAGVRLACQARSLQNATVVIPHSRKLGVRRIQYSGLERKTELDASVKKVHLQLQKPTLSDITPDLERLMAACSQHVDQQNLEIDHNIIKDLPDTLRKTGWNVTVVLHNNKIIAVEPYDTSMDLFGLALDIGTSKIVGHFVNLISGETVDIRFIENPQVLYGEDVVTRIAFSLDSTANLRRLQKLAIDGINEIVQGLEETMIDSKKIYEVVVVGNTVMHHFLLGIQPKYLVLSPFVPAFKQSTSFWTKDLNVKVNRKGVLTVLPAIAGFVGSDAVADVLSTGLLESKQLSMLLDIGTNTEIFVGNLRNILCCSCASGPAFEGGHIKHGMKAVTGAIEKIQIDSDFKVKYETVDGAKPLGLCGSAVIDVVAEMLKHCIINRHGRFNSKIKTKRLRKTNNAMEFIIAKQSETAINKDITITQKDINEIQLAKAAIYSGCSILMKRRNVKKEDVEKLFIAGAFGNCMDTDNARAIGLIPDVTAQKIMFVGNTALSGAKMALMSKKMRKKADQIANNIHYLELAIDPEFNQEFAKALLFPRPKPS